ncbi:hypothetical protein [Pseudomonas sp. WS 5410]|uniref:hypothetical protein n=1 Tax=Pseudomonas sp. WS 5410 TaxID=2717485 RepID=UPI0014738FF6|nr:hypothetical protein [Pseudomonas sp. WS 5410]NMY20833.1 hypothetical protein [Pseudomonas sp. WS 5410]
MSWLDGFDEANAINLDNRIQRTDKLPEPGIWQGFGKGSGNSLLLGGISLSNFAQSAGSASFEQDLNLSSLYFPDGAEEQIQAQQNEQSRLSQDTAESAKTLRPDPRAVGIAGQILNSAAEILPRTVAATVLAGPAGIVAGPLAAGAPAGYTATQIAKADGVDDATATAHGLIEGVATTIGAGLPGAKFVSNLAGDAAIAVGANVGIGVAQRAASAELLDRNGYHAQAAQYRALDGKAMVADAIMGAFFFGAGRAGDIKGAVTGRPRPTQEQVDSALVQNEAVHFEDGAAPGAPVDPASANMHREQLSQALAQLNRGEPVTVIDGFRGDFLRKETSVEPVAPSRDVALATARQDLEPKLRVELEQEAAGILPNVKDVKGELAILRKSLDGLDDSFKARAKDFQQQGQTRKQAEQAARQAIADERAQLTDRQSALTESLDGNRSAQQARADLNAMDRGEVPKRFQDRITQRADTIIRGFEPSKITNAVKEGVRQTHEQQLSVELDGVLRDIGHNEPEVRARSGDNQESNDVEKQAVAGNPGGKQAGKAPAEKVTASDKSEAGVISEPGRSVTGDAESPANAQASEIDLVRDAVSRNPEVMVNSGYDADGNPIKVRAADALAEIEAEHQLGVKEGQSFMAAVKCLLRG